ncbi:MAG TPA: T9SS type A sorting domain-containing protein [Candidatus Kapabacteria bacterium]|nr:T9SS type A sorting domain-containing protein [Candidatus Kapabacteria bacterium]
MKRLFYFGIIFASLATPLYAQTGYDTCAHLKEWEYYSPTDPQIAQEQYDTLRLYIELCAASDDQSYHAFLHLDEAVQLYAPDDTSRFDRYRQWLISVIYLNTTNPAYFCADLGSIAGTYQYGKYTPLGYLAVLNYIRSNHPECWGSQASNEYTKDSAYDAANGHDPTHLPSLDSMGLGFLLNHNAVTPSSYLPSQYLASFTTNPNPFKNETTLSFTLNRMAYVTVDVYDILGHKVWGDDHGYSLDAGVHQVRIDGAGLPTGTLYARISTGFGEVKTVKLVKQE